MRLRRAVVAFLLLAACSLRSEEEIEDEFDAFVKTRSACMEPSDCVAVPADCPLGCQVAVNRVHVTAVREKAQELIDEYESGGRSCAYDCIAVQGLECTMGHCALVH
jgi:hypothetical protein